MNAINRLMDLLLGTSDREADALQRVIDAARERDRRREEAARQNGGVVFDPILGRTVELPQ